MKRFILGSLMAVLLTTSVMACMPGRRTKIDKTTVASLDLNRYLGEWYEIARYDHRFERNLVGCKATYTMMDNGLIQVMNTGYLDTFDGDYRESIGKARRPDPNEPGKMEVSFFWNFYNDYWVLELAPDYSYSVVGSKSDQYLWILSRTPYLDPVTLEGILFRLQLRGYDTDRLIWVDQFEISEVDIVDIY